MHLKPFKKNLLIRYSYLFISLSLIIAFFYPVIFSNKTYFFRDIHRWFYPMKYFLSECLRNWEMPYWRSDYFCGAPFLSDIQSGFFYPLSILNLIIPFPLSFNIFIVVHFFLGFCFFYLFIRSIGLSFTTGIVTSISWCYGSYTISSINILNNLSTLIWLPAILWSYNKAHSSGKNSFYFLTIFFICISILGGEPQIFIFIVSLFFLYSLFFTEIQKKPCPFYKRPLFLSLILIICGILLSSLQIGMTYTDYSHSIRAGGLTYKEVSEFSLSPYMLKNLLFPIRFGPDFIMNTDPLNRYYPSQAEIPWLLTLYPGFIITIMAIYGILFSFSKKILFWLILFIFWTLMALGSATPLHYYFYKLFPFFRFPVKFYFLSSFAILVISGYGIDNFINFLKNKNIRINIVSAFFILVIFADLYSAHWNLNPVVDTEFYNIHHSMLDPVYKDRDMFRIYSDPDSVGKNDTGGSILDHHFKWQLMQYPNLGILNGLQNIGGAPVIELIYQHSITELLEKSWPDKIKFLKIANVKYIISNRPLHLMPELKGQIIQENPLLFRISDPMPRAWITGKLTRTKGGKIEELLDDSFDPRYNSLSDRDLILSLNPTYQKVDNIEYSANGKIRIKCTTQENGILVLSEAAYPGWRVFVNGEERECLWLNLLYQGVVLDKGANDILFLFKPYKIYLLTSLQVFFTLCFIITSQRLIVPLTLL